MKKMWDVSTVWVKHLTTKEHERTIFGPDEFSDEESCEESEISDEDIKIENNLDLLEMNAILSKM